MNADQALELLTTLLEVTIFAAGPLLFASLAAGVLVGIVQAATQINEASVSFVVKAAVVLGVLVTLGPALASRVVEYAHGNLESIAHIVR
ncbi:MAG: flagellar biosynthetic protein FliQ [Polyangiaceae bacterium]|jgi:flagellar biosynthetic protein FliQ